MNETLGRPRTDDEVFQQLTPELFGLAYRMLAISLTLKTWCTRPTSDGMPSPATRSVLPGLS